MAAPITTSGPIAGGYNDGDKTISIFPPIGHQVSLEGIVLDLASGDSMEITMKSSAHEQHIASFDSNNDGVIQDIIFPTGAAVFLKFDGNADSVSGNGFIGQVKMNPGHAAKISNISCEDLPPYDSNKATTGIVTDGVFGYGPGKTCTATIDYVPHTWPSLKFLQFDLGDGDSLTLYDGDSKLSGKSTTFTKANPPSLTETYHPAGASYIEFSSNTDGSTGQGYTIQYDFLPLPDQEAGRGQYGGNVVSPQNIGKVEEIEDVLPAEAGYAADYVESDDFECEELCEELSFL